MHENGITTKILTGDNHAIALSIAKRLGLSNKILVKDGKSTRVWSDLLKHNFEHTSVFAEIMPEDKLSIVDTASKNHITAVTGDGINDLPALKSSQVGIAVANAVDALKGCADLVLLKPGISVIKDAVIESRKIFSRIYTYSVYRISESFRLIVTITILGVLLGTYPLTPIQLILLALLNDLPIISLAFNRVKVAHSPSSINVKNRFKLSCIFGIVGVFNSILLYLGAVYIFHLDAAIIQTLYFLKLTVGGHLLLYIAHTEGRWYKFLPSKEVIIATSVTQLIATFLAISGTFMPAAISWQLAVFVWLWALGWMQIGELAKHLVNKHLLVSSDR